MDGGVVGGDFGKSGDVAGYFSWGEPSKKMLVVKAHRVRALPTWAGKSGVPMAAMASAVAASEAMTPVRKMATKAPNLRVSISGSGSVSDIVWGIVA